MEHHVHLDYSTSLEQAWSIKRCLLHPNIFRYHHTLLVLMLRETQHGGTCISNKVEEVLQLQSRQGCLMARSMYSAGQQLSKKHIQG